MIEHISLGPNGGNGPFDATPSDASDDGRSILLNSYEQLLSTDTDDEFDKYLRVGGATHLVSGPPGVDPS